MACCGDYLMEPTVGTCPNCGGPIDQEGYSTDVCGSSPEDCAHCHSQPCDGSC